MNTKQTLTSYAEEQLGHYVYALRNPIDKKIFYVGKGVGSRVLAHANGVIESSELAESQKIQMIETIHAAGLQVESFIIQHGLGSDVHAFQTESALYGILKLLEENSDQDLFSLTNIIQPPMFEDKGLMSVDDVLSIYGEPAEGNLIPHNSIFVKPSKLWKKGMTREELWESTRGWWPLSEKRIRSIRYVFAVPNLVIRAAWEVQPDDWRQQKVGDRGWEKVLHARRLGSERKIRYGFDSQVDVSDSKFQRLLNKSVAHTYLAGQGKRPSVVYLDDRRKEALSKEKNPRLPFWNTELT